MISYSFREPFLFFILLCYVLLNFVLMGYSLTIYKVSMVYRKTIKTYSLIKSPFIFKKAFEHFNSDTYKLKSHVILEESGYIRKNYLFQVFGNFISSRINLYNLKQFTGFEN